MSGSLSFNSSGGSHLGSKGFGFSLPFRRSKDLGQVRPAKKTLSDIKLQMELAFQDTEGGDAERLRFKIRSVREVKDLWILRSDVHQVIARQINQQAAAERINALLPFFEGWMPASALSKI